MSEGPYPRLAEPIAIGSLILANRLAVAPIVHNLATEDGGVTERLIDAYSKKGRGGWGLVMVEASHVSRDYAQFNRMIGIHDEKLIGGLAELAEAVKNGGARVGVQIMHPGGLAPPRWNLKRPVSPSGGAMAGVQTQELEAERIEQIIEDFARAARRAKLAGFDLVQLHGAHGFLIHQFMSPLWNQRDDRWGDPSVFATTVIRKVREAVGPRFPLSMRVSGDEFMGEGSADLEHMKKLAPLLVAAGLDCLDVSAGSTAGSGDWIGQPIYREHGCIVHLAEAIKPLVDVPVVTAGRINHPRFAEKILADGRADLVSIGRGALADPDFATKALAGDADQIRQCTACYVGCARVDVKGSMCSMNYEVGRYHFEYDLAPTRSPQKVMVVGGGVAGMEAARVAARRGHRVQLYEKSPALGGCVTSMAGSIPGLNTADLMLAVKWLRRQMDEEGVEVSLATEVTKDLVMKSAPDVVVLATGAVADEPDLPGMADAGVLSLEDYLARAAQVGDQVAVIGGQHGAEAALSLALAGKKVTIIERGKLIALAPYVLTRRFLLIRRLKRAGVEILTRTNVTRIDPGSVVVADKEGNEKTIKADTIVMARGRRPDDALAHELSGLVVVHKIGDCDQPLHTFHAMHSANRVARMI